MDSKQLGGHLLFWTVIMLTFAISEWGYEHSFQEAILFELVFLPVRLIAVYVNWFALIPQFLYKNRLLQYLLLLGAMLSFLAVFQRFLALYVIYPSLFPQWIEPNGKVFEIFKIVQGLVIITSPVAFSSGIRIFADWYEQRNKARQLEIEKREAELKYLKSQINPHFLFNTLNNLYGLSIENSKKVPGLIIKLSDFLSYSLYGTAAEKVRVGREVQLIQDFIDLERDRYEYRVQVETTFDTQLFEHWVAPLLFIPLVENAFKHGVREEIHNAIVSIKLYAEPQKIVLEVINSLPGEELVQVSSGLGLKNLKRRLELLYPGAHELFIQKEDAHFLARLKISTNG